MVLLDPYGRPVKSLRVSVTARCDFKCIYCHMEGIRPPVREEASAEELRALARVAAFFGVRSVKITGGEPLLRDDIAEIVRAFSEEGFSDISLVTNGSRLAEWARELRRAGLRRVNVKLDSLDPRTFEDVSGVPALESVLEGIEAAKEAGLRPIKLNCVLLKGLNAGEVSRLVLYAAEVGAVLQLIELVRGLTPDGVYRKYYFPASLVEEYLFPISRKVESRAFQARRRFYLREPEVVVEVVGPSHGSFCWSCTRMRFTPDGFLKPCLMRNDNLVDFVGPLRDGASFEELRELFKEAVGRRAPFSQRF